MVVVDWCCWQDDKHRQLRCRVHWVISHTSLANYNYSYGRVPADTMSINYVQMCTIYFRTDCFTQFFFHFSVYQFCCLYFICAVFVAVIVAVYIRVARLLLLNEVLNVICVAPSTCNLALDRSERESNKQNNLLWIRKVSNDCIFCVWVVAMQVTVTDAIRAQPSSSCGW